MGNFDKMKIGVKEEIADDKKVEEKILKIYTIEKMLIYIYIFHVYMWQVIHILLYTNIILLGHNYWAGNIRVN